MTILPWHISALERAQPAAANLIIGGAGAEQFALALAAKCADAPAPENHPDFLLIHPKKNKILIEEAHRVVKFCALTPALLARRLAIIFQAHLLTVAAANALLKTLEEPSGNKVIFLCAPTAQRLPPTIVSRCRIIRAPAPDERQAREWLGESGAQLLAFCGGALPETEIDMEEIARIAAGFCQGAQMNVPETIKLLKNDDWLGALQKWVSDGIRVSFGLPPRFFPEGENFSPRPAHRHAPRWLDFYAGLVERRRLADRSPARQLTLEDTLYEYKQLFG